MNIVTLLFACVALLNFSKVVATDNGRHIHSNGFHNPQPEAGAMNNRRHIHSNGFHNPQPEDNARNVRPRIQNASPPVVNPPRSRILIQRVINGVHIHEHLLFGYLEPDQTIESHSGNYGHAVVDLTDGQRLYACLENRRSPEDDSYVDSIGVGFPKEFTAVVRLSGAPRFEADITIGNERTSLVDNSVEREAQSLGLHPVGHVRYTDSNRITFDGPLYHLPQ